MAHRRSLVIGVVVALAVLGFAGTAQASGNSGAGSRDHQTVKLYDDCDPATFDAAVGPGTCAGDGDTTFQAFLKEFSDRGSVAGWFFEPGRLTISSRGILEVRNRGGETHTFTRVADFGNGCLPLLNQKPVDHLAPECGGVALDPANGKVPVIFATTAVPAGARVTFSTENTSVAHVEKYQCLIHPWMRTTVYVEGSSR
jgi:hypothetical protein